MEELERPIRSDVLARCNGNISRISEEPGLSRVGLKRQEVEVAFDSQPGLQIRGDEPQFHRVIVNLVDDAIEAMRDQKRADSRYH